MLCVCGEGLAFFQLGIYNTVLSAWTLEYVANQQMFIEPLIYFSPVDLFKLVRLLFLIIQWLQFWFLVFVFNYIYLHIKNICTEHQFAARQILVKI